MVRPLKRSRAPKKLVPKDKRGVTPLIYYGGKSRDSAWIVGHFPPHDTFVDVFGGGGAITFYKVPSRIDVYNDIGNVANFFRVLRDYGDELYDALYHTPYSREEFYVCRKRWSELSDLFLTDNPTTWQDRVEWARCWYTTIIQGYAHEESVKSPWKVSKSVDVAFAWNNHVEELPRFTERLRTIVIENLDFMKVLDMYDSEKTLFYLDPPYEAGTRAAQDNYQHEMSVNDHKRLLSRIKHLKGQFVLSMYSSPLYEQELSGFRRDQVTHLSSVQNSKSMADGRDSRTEVLWIKEKEYGLWTPFPTEESSPDVPGIEVG